MGMKGHHNHQPVSRSWMYSISTNRCVSLVLTRALHGSHGSDQEVFLNFTGRVGSGQEVFELSRLGSGHHLPTGPD